MGRQWTGIIGAVGVLWGTACPVFAAPNPILQQEQLQQARQEQRKRMERLENPGDRLNRDTKNSLQKLATIFDKEKVQERQELVDELSKVGNRAIHELVLWAGATLKKCPHLWVQYKVQ